METKVFYISKNPQAKHEFFSGTCVATPKSQPAVFEMIEDARFHNDVMGDPVAVVSGTPDAPGICIFKLDAKDEEQREMAARVKQALAEELAK